jgi:hypothetical protein
MIITDLEELVTSGCAEFSPQWVEVRAGEEVVEYFRSRPNLAPDGFWVKFMLNYQPYRFTESFEPVHPFKANGVSAEWVSAPLEAVLFRTPTKTVARIVRRPRGG